MIDAAIKDDYQTFKDLIESGTKTNQKTESGLNVPCALAYFSLDNFEKACALLNSKKINLDESTANNMSLLHLLAYANDFKKMEILLKYKPDVNRREKGTNLLPIDLTQFSTYKYVSNQKMDPLAEENSKKCRDLLLAAGSAPFKYCPPQIPYIGNFYVSLLTLAVALNNKIDMKATRSTDFFDIKKTDERTVQTFKYEKIADFMKLTGTNVTVENYSSWLEVSDMLQLNKNASTRYCIILQTGNNPVAPYQWVIFNTLADPKETLTEDSWLKVGNPDTKLSFIDFQLKDISQIIAIRL